MANGLFDTLLQRAKRGVQPTPELAKQMEGVPVMEAGMPDWKGIAARVADRFLPKAIKPAADEVSQLFQRGISAGTIPSSAPSTAIQTAEQMAGRGPMAHSEVDALIQQMQNSIPFRGGK